MNIGIIGSGHIGSTLARHLVSLGHEVSIGNSRGPQSLAVISADTGAAAVTAEQAARSRDLVIISVPQAAVPQLPLEALRSSSAVVVDTGNYYPTRDGAIDEIDNGLTDSQWVATVLGRPVVKAFNSIVASSLAQGGLPAGTAGRICLPVAGDDLASKKLVQDVIRAMGFDTIDAGSLVDSWRQQPGTSAYCRDLDATALAAALAQADENQIANCRKKADEEAAPYFTSARA
jgi:predicted dinucleotide-binding enzyme